MRSGMGSRVALLALASIGAGIALSPGVRVQQEAERILIRDDPPRPIRRGGVVVENENPSEMSRQRKRALARQAAKIAKRNRP